MVFYVIDYFATGEGRTIWLYVAKCYDKKDEEYSLKDFKGWVGRYYASGIEKYDQDRFISDYGHLVPEKILGIIMENPFPGFVFKQEFHFNAS
jgi:hypothetical protein